MRLTIADCSIDDCGLGRPRFSIVNGKIVIRQFSRRPRFSIVNGKIVIRQFSLEVTAPSAADDTRAQYLANTPVR
jgi:hypothetical protein